MAKFIGLTVNKYKEDDEGTPVLVFIGRSVDDPPDSIEPYDDSPKSLEIAAQWSEHIKGPGKDWTIGQLAMSLGDLREEGETQS